VNDWPGIANINNRIFAYKGNNEGRSLLALLRETRDSLDELNAVNTIMMREIKKLAMNPLTGMMVASQMPKERMMIPLKAADIASTMFTTRWETSSVLMKSFDHVFSAWNMASACTETFRSMMDFNHIEKRISTFTPEYSTLLRRSERLEMSLKWTRWSSSFMTKVHDLMRREKRYGLYFRVAVTVNTNKQVRLLTKEAADLIFKYPVAFGWSPFFIYKPQYTALMLTRRGNRMFLRSTVADVDIGNNNIESQVNQLKDFKSQPVPLQGNGEQQIRIVDNEVVLKMAQRGVASEVFYPNTVFMAPTPLVVNSFVNPTKESILQALMLGVGPSVPVGWEWMSDRLVDSPLSLASQPKASIVHFPFRVTFDDPNRGKTPTFTVQRDAKFQNKDLFVTGSRPRPGETYAYHWSDAFSKPFVIESVAVPDEVFLAEKPRLFFLR
jgi:hypothetical protein